MDGVVCADSVKTMVIAVLGQRGDGWRGQMIAGWPKRCLDLLKSEVCLFPSRILGPHCLLTSTGNPGILEISPFDVGWDGLGLTSGLPE